ncbi:unnamed protein product [Porites evermanni]|uniref:Uncharacterized protein n=1 Tax=Porites evermanni TaxID=104178 RepID=A0ABN8SY05_9CNID|nr:unnamed protein product [Porites evermanni]
MHHLKMVMVKTLNHPPPLPHILPLWLSKELSSQIFYIPCEVDTGTSSNILPLLHIQEVNALQRMQISCEMADSKGHMILARKQALLMAYIC